jgi:DNA invertase Pin-like site-specific DNA recombinase
VPTGQEWVFEMVNNILIEVLGTIAEQERATIRKRQEEGLAAARARGAHMGRPAATFPPNWDSVYLAWKSGAITAVEAMRRTGMKKSTFYKLVNKFENGER